MKKLLICAVPLILGGCSSILNAPSEAELPIQQIPHDDPQWQQHLTQLQQIQTYSAKGQFGYISPQERFSSHFDWQYHSPVQFSFTMSSNLSNKALKLTRNRQGLTISDSEGHARTETDIQAVMKDTLGVAFPIDQFAYWVKGLPELNGEYIVNEKRQLAQFRYSLEDKVWTVNYIEYHEDRSPHLPKMIVLKNDEQTLKIRLEEWNTP